MKRLIITALLVISVTVYSEAAKLESVGVRQEKDSYLVFFKAKTPLEYTASFMNDPPRVIVDFLETKSDLTGKILEPRENAFVSRIRTGDKSSPRKKDFRVIIELKTSVYYSVSPLPEGLALRLSHKPSAPPINPTVSPTTSAGDPQFQVSIGPEDLLDVTVFELPQFDVTARVSGDGTITMPLIGSVKVAGLSKKEAEQKVASELETKYVNNANVSISIKEYKSKQIAVLGAVKSPGPYYILSNRTLLQVITDAGGLTDGAGAKCFIFRPGALRIEIDLADLMIAGNQERNVAILPGDVINIPPAGKAVVYVLGEVKTPGPIEMTFGTPLTLLTAIARAGGLTPDAKSEVQIRRKNNQGGVTLVKVNLKNVLKGKAADLELQAEDVINVPASLF